MKKTDLAYTAGIIDGEGCIYIHKRVTPENRSRVRYSLLIKVSSTDEWLIEWLHFAWGGAIGTHSEKSRRLKNWSPAWQWTLQTKQAYEFLKLILPYLQLKKPQAELALKFQERKRKGGGSGSTLEKLAVEEAEYILMKNMKHNKKVWKPR